MLTRFTKTWHSYLFAAIWIQLLALFGQVNAIELPVGLMHESVNMPKSTDYARRISFPLEAAADISIDVPPNVEENLEFSASDGGNMDQHQDPEESVVAKTDIAHWLELQQAHQHQPDYTLFNNPMPQQQKHMKHHHSNRQVHTTSTTSSVSLPLRRCSIEISSKIPGICQSMGTIGNACISGDYIDVFNEECL